MKELWPQSLPLVVALFGAIVAFFSASRSRRHDREQQARSLLLEPAEAFAEASLKALAALRYVTPPDTTKRNRPHRNEPLLSSPDSLEDRLVNCRNAIDEVRYARSRIRLVFHPRSWAAEWSRRVLVCLRAALEEAEEFYASARDASDGDDLTLWNDRERPSLRRNYLNARRRAYWNLDGFYADVGKRLESPTWTTAKIPQAEHVYIVPTAPLDTQEPIDNI